MTNLRYHHRNYDDGRIGTICNGTGLTMATEDLIKIRGGLIANYLDLDGDSTIEDTINAFDLMENDKRVKVTFVNLFAGVLNLNTFAKGLIIGRKVGGFRKPVILRLRGLA